MSSCSVSNPVAGTVGLLVEIDVLAFNEDTGGLDQVDLAGATNIVLDLVSPSGVVSTFPAAVLPNGNIGYTTQSSTDVPIGGTWGAIGRYTLAGESEYTSRVDFIVRSSENVDTDPPYLTVAEVRAAGIPESAVDDDSVAAAICLWQQFVIRACRQWFHPRQLELRVDGNDSNTLFFGVPIISLEEIRVNDSTSALDASSYAVYSSDRYPDTRGNPRICLVDGNTNHDIYTASRRGRKFQKGFRNQYVRGVFGYVESNMAPPAMIKRALMKLVVEKLGSPLVGVSPIAIPAALGQIIGERTDGHSIKFATANAPSQSRGLSGITSDQEILTILKMYKAPIGLASPSEGAG